MQTKKIFLCCCPIFILCVFLNLYSGFRATPKSLPTSVPANSSTKPTTSNNSQETTVESANWDAIVSIDPKFKEYLTKCAEEHSRALEEIMEVFRKMTGNDTDLLKETTMLSTP